MYEMRRRGYNNNMKYFIADYDDEYDEPRENGRGWDDETTTT